MTDESTLVGVSAVIIKKLGSEICEDAEVCTGLDLIYQTTKILGADPQDRQQQEQGKE
jgi:hypothetical protein